jgi:hypothetical protein
MASRLFECDACGTYGKITLKGEDSRIEDIACCPVCGADITQVEEYEEE